MTADSESLHLKFLYGCYIGATTEGRIIIIQENNISVVLQRQLRSLHYRQKW